MKLKFELVNGHGVLVDEESKGKNVGQGVYFDSWVKSYPKIDKIYESDEVQPTHYKIIFAEPELKLEGVPVFKWRDFEVEKKSLEFLSMQPKENLNVDKEIGLLTGFFYGHKSNPARFTEEDLRKVLYLLETWEGEELYHEDKIENILKSLQKYPKYVVMDFNVLCSNCRNEKGTKKFEDCHGNYPNLIEPKLFTNSEGKSEGTIKELIWD